MTSFQFLSRLKLKNMKKTKVIVVLVMSIFISSAFYSPSNFTKAVSYEGKLIRPKGYSNIFMISKGKKHYIPNIEIFNSYGYKWEDVIEVDQSVEHSYEPVNLIKTADSDKVFYLSSYKKKFWFPTSEIFLKAGYHSVNEDVVIVNKTELDYYKTELDYYKTSKFVQGSGKCSFDSRTVFILTPFYTKRAIRNGEIFSSYGYDWRSVVGIPCKIIELLPNTVLVRAKDNYKVYKIENGAKRWIINKDAFDRNGFSFDQVEEISALDLSLYPEGNNIK